MGLVFVYYISIPKQKKRTSIDTVSKRNYNKSKMLMKRPQEANKYTVQQLKDNVKHNKY